MAVGSAAPFLILLASNVRGPEVGDGGGHHEHVRVGGVLGHRVPQLGGRADVHDVDAGRIDEAGGVAGDQRDLGAALGGDPGHRVALLAGGLRLPMKRTGSIGSRVPPAVTSTLTPARS